MKRITIAAMVDYVEGYLRYGHYEGEVEMTNEEFEQFKEDPLNFMEAHDTLDKFKFVVDDYSVDGIGDVCEVSWGEWIKQEDGTEVQIWN